MCQKIIKTILWQSIDNAVIKKEKTIGDYISAVICWGFMLFFTIGLVYIMFTENVAKPLAWLISIYAITTFPFVFPALSYSLSSKDESLTFMLLGFKSIIGSLIAPFYVYKNLKKYK